LDEVSRIGIPTDGVCLSKQGGGVWLAGVEGTALARAAAASLRLEGAFRTDPSSAVYRLGPFEDPSALTPSVAELALRVILRAAIERQMKDASPDESSAPLSLSPPEIRSIDGADWYIWLGEGGACDTDGTPWQKPRIDLPLR